jgi:hypothetical protein
VLASIMFHLAIELIHSDIPVPLLKAVIERASVQLDIETQALNGFELMQESAP